MQHFAVGIVFACFYIPDFAVQASLLPEPAETRSALRTVPLALLDGPASLPRVFATNSAARRAGIETGMTKLQVETYGGVRLGKRSLAEEEAAQMALVNFAGTFSPRVESTCPGAAILDMAGMERLLGPWGKAARDMMARAAKVGFELWVAIAGNPDTAFLAARGFSASGRSRIPRSGSIWAGVFIPAGEEAQQLACLRVDVLPVSPEMLEILNRWGIRTFQSLAALPAVAIVERLGQEGLYLQKLARGEVARPLLTVEEKAEFTASFEFEDPVETLESMFFVLNRMLQEICLKLVNAALAAQELRLMVSLEVRQIQRGEKGVERYRHEWKLPMPTQDRNLLFGLVRLELEKTTFSAPVRRLRLEAVPVKPRVAQEDFFAPPAPEAEKLEITLERLRGVVGSADEAGIACVGSPDRVDTHRPGSFTVQHFSGANETEPSTSRKGSDPSTPRTDALRASTRSAQDDIAGFNNDTSIITLRIFRPAMETSVELDGAKPHFVRLWNRHRRVLAASGPWATSGDWWNASVWWREEWDVTLKTPGGGAGFYRIYRDRIQERWFVEGEFD